MKWDNICTKKTYTKKDGTEQTSWATVGTLKTMDDGKRFIELYMFPNTAFYVFEPRKKEDNVAPPIESEAAPF